MESDSPMDRLLCGDVGYGKTEVALRAAFKATLDSKQVMVLVPTTILAQQHYGTFRERFADFPVKVEMISRFRSAAEQKMILKDFAAGKVDVLIGTHRLLSDDVKPKDLGLVIVDEEQRFGVAQKEALRRLKLRVDVLTLTATPIPRTLQMSLSGVRDITVIETPPRDRHPIQTYVGLYDEGMVERAIEREIDRGGQVYYLHNRVETIDKAAVRLRATMPNVRFVVAHGQMPEQDLERVMLEFLRGDQDVLVSTTIIENGLDIPNANTLIVERADLLGLSQLYQIRGRIGRSVRVAHAFLFHPDEAVLTEEAVARLSTLADYTELGSGFKIAMRDLEIRGAGELLGEEQSGQIAAVGLRDVPVDARGGHRATAGRRDAARRSMARVEIGIDAHVPLGLHRLRGGASGPAPADRLGPVAGGTDRPAGRTGRPLRRTSRARGQPDLPGRGAGSGAGSGGRFPVGEAGPADGERADSYRAGSRERLRSRDRRYVYAPVQGQLSLGSSGRRAERSVRSSRQCSMIYSPSPPERWSVTYKERTRVIRRFAFALLLLPSILAIYGCGGELPQGAVAQVGQSLVSQDQFDKLEAAYEAAGRVPDKKTQSEEYRTFQQSLAQYLVMLEVLRQRRPSWGSRSPRGTSRPWWPRSRTCSRAIRRGSTQALEKQKLTLDQFKESLRERLLIDEMKAAVTKDVTVTEDEVKTYYDSSQGRLHRGRSTRDPAHPHLAVRDRGRGRRDHNPQRG